MKKTIVPIFYFIDEEESKQATVSLLSLIECSDSNRNYRIHILYKTLSDETISSIQALEKRNFSICFYNVKEDLLSMEKKVHNADYSVSTYQIYLIAKRFPLYNKVICLKNNTILFADIGKAYDIDLKDHLIGAVKDPIVIYKEVNQYVQNALGLNEKDYFNDGLLLLNTKKWREVKLYEKFIDLTIFTPFKAVLDQDYLNILCKNDVKYIAQKWNVPSFKEEIIKRPAIINFDYSIDKSNVDNDECLTLYWMLDKMLFSHKEAKEDFNLIPLNRMKIEENNLNSIIKKCNVEVDDKYNYSNQLKKLKEQDTYNNLSISTGI